MLTLNTATVAISLKGDMDIGLDDNSQLIIRNKQQHFSLGKVNAQDIDNLCEYLQRLKIHTEGYDDHG